MLERWERGTLYSNKTWCPVELSRKKSRPLLGLHDWLCRVSKWIMVF